MSRIQERMAAIEETIAETDGCSACQGAGTVRYWSEVAYFEDVRACPRCDAGRLIDSKIAGIIRRAQLDERFSKR